MKHIDYLLDLETRSGIKFDRTSRNSIVISLVGYNPQELHDAEVKLIHLGCKYNFDRGVQMFDPHSGRTYTHFYEPKEKV